MQCDSYFQPFIDHLRQPATAHSAPTLQFLAAGNRTEANRFVTYMTGTLRLSVGKFVQLTGTCKAYFSDRVGSGGQPFEVNRSDTLDVFLTVPNGPLTLGVGEQTVSRFSAFECGDDGLLVCTSDLDRSVLVLSFLPGELSLEP
jgi:hypothetical protein